jgi:hypothetical protein
MCCDIARLERGIRSVAQEFRQEGSDRLLHLGVIGCCLGKLQQLVPGGQIGADGQWRDSCGNVGLTSDEVGMARVVFRNWSSIYKELPREFPDYRRFTFEELRWALLSR